MFSISEVAKQTGFNAHTLRYYEKIGLVSSPTRLSGKRFYSEGDIRLLKFVKLLKSTGMSLDDIQEFLIDGCLLESKDTEEIKWPKIEKRISILEKHFTSLEQQRKEIESVMELTNAKLNIYHEMLKDRNNED